MPNESHTSDEDEIGSDVDLFLLSQDIDSAIERFLPSSSPSSTHTGNPNVALEEFIPAKLNDWDLTTCCNDGGSECACFITNFYRGTSR